MMTEPVKIILFDLGGVLVQWDGTSELTKLVGGSFSEADARRFWFLSPAVKKFESGLITPGKFSRDVIAELGLNIQPEEWLAKFISWDRGPYPGTVELLKELDGRYEMGCLSNNNVLHWNRLCDQHDLGRFLTYRYLSHEIGLFKPDPRIFEHVLRDLKVPPETILYLDDNPENIEPALDFGMRAEQTRGLGEVREVLSREGRLKTGVSKGI